MEIYKKIIYYLAQIAYFDSPNLQPNLDYAYSINLLLKIDSFLNMVLKGVNEGYFVVVGK